MAVQPDISLAHVRKELKEGRDLIDDWGLDLDTSMLAEDDLRFRVSGRASDGELYIVEFRCDDYREIPPFVEFIDPESGEAGITRAYPKGVFHKKPCVCARFNRKSYAEHTGLHSGWEYGNWGQEAATNHLGGMIAHIFRAIEGRMQGRSYQGRRNG